MKRESTTVRCLPTSTRGPPRFTWTIADGPARASIWTNGSCRSAVVPAENQGAQSEPASMTQRSARRFDIRVVLLLVMPVLSEYQSGLMNVNPLPFVRAGTDGDELPLDCPSVDQTLSVSVLTDRTE